MYIISNFNGKAKKESINRNIEFMELKYLIKWNIFYGFTSITEIY
jgi:hypothetical protein